MNIINYMKIMSNYNKDYKKQIKNVMIKYQLYDNKI